MEVSITEFRRQLFTLMNQAIEGKEIWVLHKGCRLKLTPERKPKSKLSRLTALDYIVQEPLDGGSMLAEMTKAWESDWDDLDRLS